MKGKTKKYSIFFYTTTVMFVASILLLFVSFKIGIAKTDIKEVPGFIEKTNWSLQPLFWPVFALLIHFGWHYYKNAWLNLPSQNILWRNNTLISKSDATKNIIKSLNNVRIYIVVLAVLFGLFFTIMDAGCLWKEYGVLNNKLEPCVEKDFTIAFKLKEFTNVNKTANGWFVVIAYFLQGGLIAYAWIAFLQLVLHSYSFLMFEKLRSNKEKLKILLNYRDPLREYGLTDVNRAINITYIFIAIAMVLPVLSAYWNDTLNPDSGQWLLRLFLPLILILPAIIPIIERFRRKQEINKKIINETDQEAIEDNDKQRLWPFEKTEIGLFGKVAAMVAIGEYLYLLTKNIKDLFNFI